MRLRRWVPLRPPEHGLQVAPLPVERTTYISKALLTVKAILGDYPPLSLYDVIGGFILENCSENLEPPYASLAGPSCIN
jgi:hypothetical protein